MPAEVGTVEKKSATGAERRHRVAFATKDTSMIKCIG